MCQAPYQTKKGCRQHSQDKQLHLLEDEIRNKVTRGTTQLCCTCWQQPAVVPNGKTKNLPRHTATTELQQYAVNHCSSIPGHPSRMLCGGAIRVWINADIIFRSFNILPLQDILLSWCFDLAAEVILASHWGKEYFCSVSQKNSTTATHCRETDHTQLPPYGIRH